MNSLSRSFNWTIRESACFLVQGWDLAITKRLIELMNGSIRVESAVGIGSAFHFVIQVDTTGCEHSPGAPPEFAGKSVLIAASESTSLDNLVQQLENMGLHVMPVSSIQNALTLVKGTVSPIDAIIVDMSLIEHLGIAFADAIQQDHGGVDAPWLILMGAISDGIINSYRAVRVR